MELFEIDLDRIRDTGQDIGPSGVFHAVFAHGSGDGGGAEDGNVVCAGLRVRDDQALVRLLADVTPGGVFPPGEAGAVRERWRSKSAARAKPFRSMVILPTPLGTSMRK